MPDFKIYKTQDLVLQVKRMVDPVKFNLAKWDDFLDVLCGDREYQKEAIRNVLIYIASGEYRSIEDLVEDNWRDNPELRERYKDVREYEKKLPLPHKLSGVVDLATGTGKSYVMYGVAQICLSMGLVQRVLVLCPSLTIERGLREKFDNMAGDSKLKDALANDALVLNPRIVDANRTIKIGDIAIENVHAVYERTGSAIRDSLRGNGERVIVLNDEVHHAYNSTADKDIRKWREFLLSHDYNFKYVIGFTGTAYVDDVYFNDVLYRYPIRQAVDDKVIKSVEYVAKDDSIDQNEKFQKIYDNHEEFTKKYRLIRPISILVTRDIARAKTLREDLIEFLMKKEKLERKIIERKVLIVTSHVDHKKNVAALSKVDTKDSSVEWIISVSMLTEGWDVKNVFQIVPWEDRAFNSKLLIAQVLGRGLRIPNEYKTPQPKVRIFNHDAWSRNIRGLVDEILEMEVRLESVPLKSGEREKYHCDLYRIDYERKETPVRAKKDTAVFDYSKKLINLVSQTEQVDKETEYEDLAGVIKPKHTIIHKDIYTIHEVVRKIVDTFETRDFEAKIRFPKGTYDKEHLPPEDEIAAVIRKSMDRVGIKSGVLTEDNAMRVFTAFQTLFRKRGSTIILERKLKTPTKVSTRTLEVEGVAVGAVKHGVTVFYSDEYQKECSEEQSDILQDIISNENLPRSASREVNRYCLKTPLSIVITKQEPERRFVDLIVSSRVAQGLDAWIKSRDQGFYAIEYSVTTAGGRHSKQHTFNPDFFLKSKDNIAVIELKSDGDDSDDNKAKLKWGREYFRDLNEELRAKGIGQRYFFHFLSPASYSEFIEYLVDGRLFKGEFRSALEDILER